MKVDWSAIGKESVKVANLMATRNYDMFRYIEGNRPIDNHFKKIMKMIEAVGTLYCPILVNEKNEIVDGQHRFEAFRRLNLLVLYVVQNGIGIKEVRAMNSVAQNWKAKENIYSYAHGEEAKQDYIYLENLQKMYPKFPVRIYTAAVTGSSGGGDTSKQINEGEFKCSQEQYEDAIKVLDWLNNFRKFVEQTGGKKEYMYHALMYCFIDEEIDNEYLLKKFEKYYRSLGEIASINGALQEIEDKIYNYQLRTPREPVGISANYKRYARGKMYRTRKV